MMKEQHPAQPVLTAPITNQLWMTPGIAHGNAKVMVLPTEIVRYSRLGSGKDKNPRFAIMGHFIVEKGRAAFRTVDHHAGQDSVRRSALRDRAGRIQDVHG